MSSKSVILTPFLSTSGSAARCVGYGVVCLLALAILTSGSCEDADRSRDDIRTGSVRIVSFSPAMSRIAVDLGLGELIVGRTGYCTAVDANVPVIGDLHAIDFETLLRVDPDLICVQPPSTGLDRKLADMASRHDWHVLSARLNTIEDISQYVQTLAAATAERLPPTESRDVQLRAKELAAQLDTALEPLSEPIWDGRVLILGRTDPPLAFAHDTFLHDLVTALGATNAAPGRGWVELTIEDVVRLDPDGVLVISPTVDGEPIDVVTLAGPLGELEITANRTGCIARIGHSDALLPSTALVEIRAQLQQVLQQWAKE